MWQSAGWVCPTRLLLCKHYSINLSPVWVHMHSNMSTEHVQDCQWTHAFQRACWPELAKDRNSQSSRADVPITHVVILWSKEGAEPGTYDTMLWATAMTFSGSLSSFTSRPHCDFMVSLSSSPATSNIAMLFTQYSRPDQSTFTRRFECIMVCLTASQTNPAHPAECRATELNTIQGS